ncbi:MAG: 23S rRNA (pseudouridine(1915)-N(3))-methyltransferase RlmH, partial [Chloroflexi bacterium]|nr:23S rRNA (pseudouridine(1915)-N(3))-methyltransferase RlmH [Chloroflexota bacterium]
MFRFPGQLDVVAVGKMRTKHWLTGQDDYLKRLQRYGNVRLVEVKDAV